jgi:superfamily II DNA or RNA helicase
VGKYTLRPYQEAALAKAYKALDEDITENGETKKLKRFLWQSPVGSGKTLLASEVIKRALYKGKKVLFLAHRIELLNQPYNKLLEMDVLPNNIGIIRGSEKKRFNPGAAVQIASIMSLIGRTLPDADIIIVDEAHRVCGESFTKVISNPKYKDSTIIGLSASPERLDGKPLRSTFQRIIVVAQPMELIEDGWIVDPTIFAPDDSDLPDLSDVEIMAGDYNRKQLGKAVNRPHLVGAIVDHWLKRAKGLQTMCFASGIIHSKAIEASFLAAGIRCKHIDGKTPDGERAQVLIDLAEGRLDVVTNANIFIEGIDVPSIKCVIMARPTKSRVIQIQAIGRGARPYNNLKFVVLDHANNISHHGHPMDDQQYSLDGRVKRSTSGVKRCTYPGCGAYARLPAETCPFGHPLYDPDAPPRVARPIRTVDGELVEFTRRNMKDETKHAAYDRLWMKAYADGSSKEAAETWVNAVYRSKFDEEPKWLPPARPTYTVEQKQKALNGWLYAASNSGLGIAWVRNKYETKFQEPMPMDKMAEAAEPLPRSEPEEKQAELELPVSVEVEL